MAVTYRIEEENRRVCLYGPPTWEEELNPYSFEFSWFQEVEDSLHLGPSWFVKYATRGDVYAALAVARDELVERGLIKENTSWRPAASPTG